MSVRLYESIGDFFESLESSRILCLDFGERKIGIAVSDTTGLVAFPHSTYYRRNIRKDMGVVCSVLNARGARSIVMGLPLQSNGCEGDMCGKVRLFAHKLIKKCGVGVYLHDERYTTAMASRITQEVGLCRKASQKVDDKISAVLILQQVLDMSRALRVS